MAVVESPFQSTGHTDLGDLDIRACHDAFRNRDQLVNMKRWIEFRPLDAWHRANLADVDVVFCELRHRCFRDRPRNCGIFCQLRFLLGLSSGMGASLQLLEARLQQ